MFPTGRPRGPARPTRPMHQTPPRPPRDPFMFGGPGRPVQGQQQNSGIQNVLSMFQSPDGNLDFEKVIGTAQQINGIYKQVSPMISRFINR
ncbi:YppG family protein [Oceanobacillus salinisoli]|uniref:YppG family protein n=1 Tax=Oceanobacillus salinisoli TaxID=2678611 RepID=UPI0012E29086|nr:YppG family protein [Oceanobacillus salinisoli]